MRRESDFPFEWNRLKSFLFCIFFFTGFDGTQSSQGTFALTTLATGQKYIGQWIKFEEPYLTLQPGETRKIPFTVKIPANIAPGTYNGGIAAETGNFSETGEKNSRAVTISSRIVVKLFVKVPGEILHRYEWSNFTYQPGNENKKSSFLLHFRNIGNTVVVADPKIEIQGFPPIKKSLLHPPATTLFPENNLTIPIRWEEESFFGYYNVKAKVQFSQYDIVNNTKSKNETEVKELTLFIPFKWETPAGKAVMGGVGIMAGVVIVLIIKKIRLQSIRKSSTIYEIQPNESLESIAEKYQISWKKLTIVNKMKAPYHITVGEKILIPPKKTTKNI